MEKNIAKSTTDHQTPFNDQRFAIGENGYQMHYNNTG